MRTRKKGCIAFAIALATILFIPTETFAKPDFGANAIESLMSKQLPTVQLTGSSYRTQDEGTTFTLDMVRLFHLDKEVRVALILTKMSESVTPDDFVGIDVIPKEFTVVFAPKERSKSFSIQTAFDKLVEGDETFMVEIVSVDSEVGGVVGPIGRVECTIMDIPLPVPSIRLNSAYVEEASASSTLVAIELDSPPLEEVGGDFIAEFILVNGTAKYGVDYTVELGNNTSFREGVYRVNIPVGETSANIIIQPIADEEIEADEAIILTLVIENGGRLKEGGSILHSSLLITDKPILIGG